MLTTNMARLSSGLRVNSAKDDVAGNLQDDAQESTQLSRAQNLSQAGSPTLAAPAGPGPSDASNRFAFTGCWMGRERKKI